MKMVRGSCNIAPFVILLVLLQSGARVSMAVTCSPTQLAVCANAIMGSAPPSPVCCSKLREQKPCLCQYLKDPNLRKFVSSPNARKVATTCGVPFPRC